MDSNSFTENRTIRKSSSSSIESDESSHGVDSRIFPRLEEIQYEYSDDLNEDEETICSCCPCFVSYFGRNFRYVFTVASLNSL